MSFGTRNKHCRLCQNGHNPEDHDCRLNWSGSAKAMEPDIAVDIIIKNSNFEKEKVIVTTLAGDDDSSTIAAVRREANRSIVKWSDVNHAQKILSKNLYAAKLKKPVIDYLKHLFGCALKANKGDVEATEASLKSIVPHVFDQHENCRNWCKFAEDPINYKHKYLPGGKGLEGQELQDTLTQIFNKFSEKANELHNCASSQVNESFNAIVTSKTPKNVHYNGSESYDTRVAAAACQKNIGTSYIVDVNKKLNLSPGKHTDKYREIKDKIRVRRAEKSKTIDFKRRRSTLLKLRKNSRLNNERKEGITYSTGAGFDIIPDIQLDIIEDNCSNGSIVYFDLETTGFDKPDICQIAAKCNDLEFNAYIVPVKKIPPKVSQVTGLTVINGELFLHGNKVQTTPKNLAMVNFIAFLKSIGDSVILTAHNGRLFDAPVLVQTLQGSELWEEFLSIVAGFTDTLPILKKKLPERRKQKLLFNQTDLAKDLLNIDITAIAHNAVNDVSILQQIINKVKISNDELVSASITVATIVSDLRLSNFKKSNKNSMECLKSTVSASMITKILKAGISLNALQEAFTKSQEGGVKMLLSEDIKGHPRVTKSQRVISAIIEGVRNSLNSNTVI